MPTSLVSSDSLLVVDVGSVTTRATLFDVVVGRYRFLGSGSAVSTAGAPFYNVSEGVRFALDQLQEATGRLLVDLNEQLIIPSARDGSGVDTFAATISAGPPLRIVIVGLLEDVSLESVRRLAASTYGTVLKEISLNDRSRTDIRMNEIIRLQPDLILIAGGTNNGASQSVLDLLESIGLACYSMPEQQRPQILYAGNQALKDEVRANLGRYSHLHFSPNVRPTIENEQLSPARARVARLLSSIRSRQISGVEEINNWSRGGLLPTATSMGRVIRFQSLAYGSEKGVLGVDVGAAATSIAAAFAGNLSLSVYPQFGLGSNLVSALDHLSLHEITRWFTSEISDGYVLDYIHNKSLYPATIPTTIEDWEIESALTRQFMLSAVRASMSGFPPEANSPGENLLPWVEPIVAVGSVLTQAPSLAHSVLMMLDGLQPTGVTTIYLDKKHILANLGVAAALNPHLAVQVLYSNPLLHLGTVIAPVGSARPGTHILRIRIAYEEGEETNVDIRYGVLEMLPIPQGKTARINIQPLHNFDVGIGGLGRGRTLRVTGGAMGVIIDARGRPYSPPGNPEKRRELYKKWLRTLGG